MLQRLNLKPIPYGTRDKIERKKKQQINTQLKEEKRQQQNYLHTKTSS